VFVLIIPLLFYDLSVDKQKRMLEDLAERRERLAAEAQVVFPPAFTAPSI
jgi:hypothetical protein